MREIKFRAWDKEANEMIYNSLTFEMRALGYYDDGKSHKSCSQKCGKPCKEQNQFIGYVSDCPAFAIMRFTGLLDKRGVEIYEGDIFRITDKPPEDNTVEYYLGMYHLEPHGLGLSVWYGNGEVIGNIYEGLRPLELSAQPG